MFRKIDHIEIVPSNIDRTIEFYTGIFGFTLKERMKVDAGPLDEVVYLELGGTVVELLGVKNATPIPPDPWQVGYQRLALEVEDMDKALAFLKTKGIDPTWGPMTLGKSKRAEINDPDGLSIELRQW